MRGKYNKRVGFSLLGVFMFAAVYLYGIGPFAQTDDSQKTEPKCDLIALANPELVNRLEPNNAENSKAAEIAGSAKVAPEVQRQLDAACKRIQLQDKWQAAYLKRLESVEAKTSNEGVSWKILVGLALAATVLSSLLLMLLSWIRGGSQKSDNGETAAAQDSDNYSRSGEVSQSRFAVDNQREVMSGFTRDISKLQGEVSRLTQKLNDLAKPLGTIPAEMPSPETALVRQINDEPQPASQTHLQLIASEALSNQICALYQSLLDPAVDAAMFDEAMRRQGWTLHSIIVRDGEPFAVDYQGATATEHVMGARNSSSNVLTILPSREYFRNFSSAYTEHLYAGEDIRALFSTQVDGSSQFKLVQPAAATGSAPNLPLQNVRKGVIAGFAR